MVTKTIFLAVRNKLMLVGNNKLLFTCIIKDKMLNTRKIAVNWKFLTWLHSPQYLSTFPKTISETTYFSFVMFFSLSAKE